MQEYSFLKTVGKAAKALVFTVAGVAVAFLADRQAVEGVFQQYPVVLPAVAIINALAVAAANFLKNFPTSTPE